MKWLSANMMLYIGSGVYIAIDCKSIFGFLATTLILSGKNFCNCGISVAHGVRR